MMASEARDDKTQVTIDEILFVSTLTAETEREENKIFILKFNSPMCLLLHLLLYWTDM